jgi:hypothetical protein
MDEYNKCTAEFCFEPDTEVRMSSGAAKAMDQLQEGDEVLVVPKPRELHEKLSAIISSAFGSGVQPQPAKFVVHTHSKHYHEGDWRPAGVKVTLSDGAHVTTTLAHEFAVYSDLSIDMVMAGELAVGDSIPSVTGDGGALSITKLENVSMTGVFAPLTDPPGLLVLANGAVVPPSTRSGLLSDVHQLDLAEKWLSHWHSSKLDHPCLFQRAPDGHLVVMSLLLDYLKNHPDEVSETDGNPDNFLSYIEGHMNEFPEHWGYCANDPAMTVAQ